MKKRVIFLSAILTACTIPILSANSESCNLNTSEAAQVNTVHAEVKPVTEMPEINKAPANQPAQQNNLKTNTPVQTKATAAPTKNVSDFHQNSHEINNIKSSDYDLDDFTSSDIGNSIDSDDEDTTPDINTIEKSARQSFRQPAPVNSELKSPASTENYEDDVEDDTNATNKSINKLQSRLDSIN